jgi:hypothetical protein
MSRLIAVAPSNSTGAPEPIDDDKAKALSSYSARSKDELR